MHASLQGLCICLRVTLVSTRSFPSCLIAGSIDYEEFLAATVNLNHLEKEDTMYNAFRHFDTDNSGYITQTEMEDALSVS